MRLMQHALVLPVLLAISGCAWLFGEEGEFRERAMDYKDAQSIESLKVPAGMEAKELKQRYPIPTLGQGNFYVPKDSDDLPRPQALVSVDESAGLELRADEDERQWLVVEQPAATLWPQLRDFLISNGFTIDHEDAAKGTLETGWLKPRRHDEDEFGTREGGPDGEEDDGPGFWDSFFGWFSWGEDNERVRFHLSMSAGKDDGDTIVTINQIETRRSSDSLPTADEIEWPDEPEDPEMVEILYNELMDFLGEGGRQVGVSVLSQDLKALPKFVMTYDGNGYPVLVINQDFNRAWQEVGMALQRARIPTDDLDRSLGIYYLGKADPDDDDEQPLQLRLSRSETGVQVSVQLDDDALAPKEDSARILNRLRESLE